jgi:hypothetical protein
LLEAFVVCTKGKAITPEQAKLMVRREGGREEGREGGREDILANNIPSPSLPPPRPTSICPWSISRWAWSAVGAMASLRN